MQTVVTGSPHDPLDDLRPLPLPDWESRGSFKDIRYDVAEGIAKLTICRPERRNAFRPQTLFELTDAFTMARDDPDVGVIVLCGEGPDAFCSGGDQKIRGDDGYIGDDEVAQRGIGRLNVLDLQILMRRIPKPIVAMIAGYAIGGGHILHLVCDLSIAADNARFGQTGPKVGSFDGGYGSSILARTIGLKRAKEVWFLCRQYGAEQALDWGLVNTVVPLDDLERETVAWCRQMLTLSPIALRMIKAGMNAADDGLAGVQQLAGDATMLFYMTEEGQEGRNAFVEHRAPDFSRFPAPPVSPPLKMWVAGARPRTLPAAIVPVVVGTAAGYLSSGHFTPQFSGTCHTAVCASFDRQLSWLNAVLALIVALGIQIGTNYVNDYADGVRGTDEHRVGPVRLVAGKLASVREVKIAALIAFGIAALAGLGLAARVTWWLIPIGLVCGIAGWGYTGGPRPYGYLGFGELFVFVFFGLVATGGSAYVQHAPFVTSLAGHLFVYQVRLVVRLLGGRARGLAGRSPAAGQQPARHRDGHRVGQEDAGRAPRTATRRPVLLLHPDGRGAVHRSGVELSAVVAPGTLGAPGRHRPRPIGAE